MGLNAFPQQGGGTDFFKMTPTVSRVNDNIVSVAANSYSADILTINGKGLVTNLQCQNETSSKLFWTIVVDGVTHDLGWDDGSDANGVFKAGGAPAASTGYRLQEINGPIPFKTSFIVKCFNANSTANTDPRSIMCHYLVA